MSSASGAPAVQARSEGKRAETLATEASLAAFTLQGITLPRGRDRLGASVRLRGTGMAIRRQVALANRFSAPASEYVLYTLDPLLDGVDARMSKEPGCAPRGPSWSTFGGQRMPTRRDESQRRLLPTPPDEPRVRQLDIACLKAACLLATPPFAVAVLSLLAGSHSER